MGKSINCAILICCLLLRSMPAKANLFPSRLFSQIAKDFIDDNIVISPTTAYLALGLILFGITDTIPELYDIVNTMDKGKVQLSGIKIDNLLYVDSTLSIQPFYQHLVTEVLGGRVELVDFSDVRGVTKQINSKVQVGLQMRNKLHNIIRSNAISNATKLVIANAAYFRTKWNVSGGRGTAPEIHKLPFYYSRGKRMIVDTIKVSDDWLCYGDQPHNLNMHFIQLPIPGNKLFMTILLPKSVDDNLRSLSSKLKWYDLKNLTSQCTFVPVHYQLPKFKVEFSVPLESVLRQMGVGRIFDSIHMNGMTSSSPLRPFHVATMMHTSFVEMDEEHIVGGSVTNTKIRTASKTAVRESEPEYEFIANHPFIFTIQNDKHVFFIGRVMRPKTN